LRYVHDPVTQEFVNIGVAVYSREGEYLRARCTTQYARIARMFAKIDGNQFSELILYVQQKINEIGLNLPTALPLEPRLAIRHLLANVLPPDDSSVQFSHAGVGLSHDLDKTVAELYDRYVSRYASTTRSSLRDD
jgi:hypothetical protein